MAQAVAKPDNLNSIPGLGPIRQKAMPANSPLAELHMHTQTISKRKNNYLFVK